jgi:hypothetical protein
MIRNLVLCGLSLLSLQAGAQTIDCRHIGSRLNALATADQQVRQEWRLMERDAKATAADRDALQRRWHAVDRQNLGEFKAIVAACGWPATTKDSHSAWLLAQHADADLAFQRQARKLLDASVRAGVGEARDLAYLSDRIAANEGRPQEYGTQFSQTGRCALKLDPVDNPDLVRQRRLAIGLPSLEEYEAEGRRRFLPADCPKQGAGGTPAPTASSQ